MSVNPRQEEIHLGNERSVLQVECRAWAGESITPCGPQWHTRGRRESYLFNSVKDPIEGNPAVGARNELRAGYPFLQNLPTASLLHSTNPRRVVFHNSVHRRQTRRTRTRSRTRPNYIEAALQDSANCRRVVIAKRCRARDGKQGQEIKNSPSQGKCQWISWMQGPV